MTELEIMIRAKKYIDNLANGIDPLTGQPTREDDIVNNVRISRCLFYVSGVLQKVIDNGGEVEKTKLKRSDRAEFSLTDEQIRSLEPENNALSVTKVAAVINKLIDEDIMKKLKVTDITDWLVSTGILMEIAAEDGKIRKLPTPAGIQIGLCEKEFVDYHRGIQKYVVYDRNAQQFIFDNIYAIVEFARRKEADKELQK